MAIEKTIAKRTLGINVKDGYTASGTDKFKCHNYPNVKETASNEDIFAVGNSIAGLINKELSDISVTEKSMLSDVMEGIAVNNLGYCKPLSVSFADSSPGGGAKS